MDYRNEYNRWLESELVDEATKKKSRAVSASCWTSVPQDFAASCARGSLE